MKHFSLCIVFSINFFLAFSQNVGVGTTIPDASAMLDITSTDKGLLIPRVIDTATIAAPVKGLMIYATSNNKFYYHDGISWQQILVGGNGMDSLWYKKDSINYSAKKYVGINTDYSLIKPQANLQMQGSLLVQQPIEYNDKIPTHIHTMDNTANIHLFTAQDSVGRIYDPGGANTDYLNNTQGNVRIVLSGIGLPNLGMAAQLSFNKDDWGLAVGDTLWISNTSFPGCRTNYQYFFTNNQLTAPSGLVVQSQAGFPDAYIIFRSNNVTVSKGFDITFRKLYTKTSNLIEPSSDLIGNILYFSPSNGALRSGTFNKQNNIGDYSTAFGYNTQASGLGAFAAGYSSQAQEDNSIAIGTDTKASGYYSTAIGVTTIASGERSTALGSATKASGNYSTAMGLFTEAAGSNSTATGKSTTASGYISTAMGFNTTASGNYSTAMGLLTTASGLQSTALGSYVTASGLQSIALGSYVTASGLQSTALGSYVTADGSGTFAIGDNSTSTPMNGGVDNRMYMRFAKGYQLYTAGDLSIGMQLPGGSNSWSALSDVRRKEKFLPINGEDFLHKIAAIPLTTWNYIGQDSKAYRHYGPMAQDFYVAFGKDKYGTIGCDTLINQQDFLGVNLVAIQALEKRTQPIEKIIQTNEQLIKENAALKTMMLQIRKELDELKANKQ